MGQNINKLLLLLWKNVIILKRHPIHTIIEIIAPILFCSILIIVRALITPVSHSAQFYTSFENKIPILTKLQRPVEIAWSPQNPFLEEIIHNAVKEVSSNNITIHHKSFKTGQDLEKHLNNEFNKRKTLAGIEFNDSLANASNFDYQIDITLRFPGELRSGIYAHLDSYNLIDYSWKTNLLFPLYPVAGPRSYDVNTGAEPSYNYEGYLKLQQEISCAIINHLKIAFSNESFKCKPGGVLMQRFPATPWVNDDTLKILQPFLGLILLLSLLYNCINTIKLITIEKEKQLKETMKIMGLPNWLYWTTWFIQSIFIILLVTLIISVMLTAKWYYSSDVAVFSHSNVFIIIIFLLIYGCAIITFCFAISVFFSKANTASSIAGVLWFLLYFPYLLTQNSVGKIALFQKLLFSLFFNSAMGFGFKVILTLERKGEGIQWTNIWRPASPNENLVLGHVMIMLIIDTIIHLLITLYVDAIFPGEYGIGKPWNFLFLKSTWCSSTRYHNDTLKFENDYKQNEFHEKEPDNLPVSMQLKYLRKEFSNKIAVNDISLNIFQNQLTILLGHNGAGKTTTMSILTGMFSPTKGTAIINGYDIRTDMQKIRNSLGLCPQHNILFDELTVYEHLYFYGLLKGIPKFDIKNEIKKYIRLLHFEDKINSRASTLSGGMQRKLSVGIALCGGSKIVLLDEPTAGMDPNARRELWKLLKAQKAGRTILLTTHFMDEADLLGDRIAIMAKGKIQCCGSSFFLKKKYGAGYHLIIVKSSNCDVDSITKLLQKYVPAVKIKSDIEFEVTFSLSEGLSSIFDKMLFDLEQNTARLGILSFGISLTTLEDVFIKVGRENSQEESCSDEKVKQVHTITKANTLCNYLDNFQSTFKTENILNISNQDNSYSIPVCSLWYKQVVAMMMKLSLSYLRSWPLLAIHTLIPIICLLVTAFIINAGNVHHDLPNHKIELISYKNSVSVLTYNEKNMYFQNYINILKTNDTILVNWGNENMTTKIFEKESENKPEFTHQYIVGATFNENDSTIAWFNNEPYHSPPLSLQLVMNTILHKEVSSNYSLQFYNHPLPFGAKTKFAQLMQTNAIGFQIALSLGFSMAFVTAYYITFCIQERVCKAKHLQFVSGVNVFIFWTTSFVFDFFTFLCTSTWIIITFLLLRLDNYSSQIELILMCFGFAVIPFTYVVSFMFKTPSTGYTKIILFNIFTGITLLIIEQIFKAGNLRITHIANCLHPIFLLSPHYSFSSAITEINKFEAVSSHCNTIMNQCLTLRYHTVFSLKTCKRILCNSLPICCEIPAHHFSWIMPGIGANLTYMISVGVTFMLILFLIEYQCFTKLLNVFWKKYDDPHQLCNSNNDSDVHIENEKVRSAKQEDLKIYNIVLRNLTKYYSKFLAVDNICIGIKNYECFGLLGINGAGKTTTFKMLTGDMKMSSGNVWINGLNIQTHMKSLSKSIGYCPQFDALLENLTCRETLTIFGLIRGLKYEICKNLLEILSKNLNFSTQVDKKVKELSKGNKRKLSIAIALLGNPTTLFFDEPTAGMDPTSKRCFWNEINTLRNSGKCIVITSHSMEECEALCTRLTIMVNGQFKCLGSIQHLKNKFSQGYTLTIKIKKDFNSNELTEITKFVQKKFKNVILRDMHQELLTYYISDNSLSWSKLFGVMESAKQTLRIEDYSLGQCSLEQVFLTFAKQQQESRTTVLEDDDVVIA